MKKITYVLAGWIVSMVLFVQCGEEPEMPSIFHRDWLRAPTNLTSEVQDQVVLRWSMPDTTNVVQYLVSVSDSSGVLYEALVDSTYAEFNLSLADSVWYYFQVSAVDADRFKGPASEVDSLLVY